MMKKVVTICFRTSNDIRSGLQKIAASERKSMSSVIESVVYAYLRERAETKKVKEERRSFPRKTVSFPALIRQSESAGEQMQAGLIVDISTAGVQICLPREYSLQVREDTEASRIEIIFTLPTGKRPVTMQCSPQRVFASEDDQKIGATFTNADFPSILALQNYLIQ